MSNILVAGGSGFIGNALAHRLVSLGDKVRATFYTNEPKKSRKIAWLHCDLRNEVDCARAVKSIDTVFMCAAVTSGAAVIVGNPLVHVTDNIVMIVRLLAAAHKADVKRFVFISSSTVYPDTGMHPNREDEWCVGEPYHKYWWVGNMKRYAERLCLGYAHKLKNPIIVGVIRPSNVYGPGDKFDPGLSHVVPALVRKVCARGDPIEVWGTGNDIRDLIFIDDLVDGLVMISEIDRSYLAANIASGKGIAIRDVLSLILDIEGYMDARISYLVDKPTTIPVRLLDTRMAETLLGFKAKTPLRVGLTATLEGYKELLRCES